MLGNWQSQPSIWSLAVPGPAQPAHTSRQPGSSAPAHSQPVISHRVMSTARSHQDHVNCPAITARILPTQCQRWWPTQSGAQTRLGPVQHPQPIAYPDLWGKIYEWYQHYFLLRVSVSPWIGLSTQKVSQITFTKRASNFISPSSFLYITLI